MPPRPFIGDVTYCSRVRDFSEEFISKDNNLFNVAEILIINRKINLDSFTLQHSTLQCLSNVFFDILYCMKLLLVQFRSLASSIFFFSIPILNKRNK